MPETDTVEHEYHAYGAAAELYHCFAPEVLMEGAAGTGKTRGILHRIADLCESYPGVRVLVCRDTRTSCTESILVTLERDVIPAGHPWIQRDVSRGQRDDYRCVNGSVIVVGGLDHPERLFSTEWDIVYVAEAIEITEDAWEKFARAMRNKGIALAIDGKSPIEPGIEVIPGVTQAVDDEGKPRWWTQRIADCNPGAPGHWLNQRALRGAMVRLKSRHEDNPTCSTDYLDGLRALTGHRRARLYEGRWTAAEGSVFPEFDPAKHVIEPFDIPDTWPSWWFHDAGYDHPAANLCLCVSPTGRTYLRDEWYGGGRRVPEHAAWIKSRNHGRNIRDYYADPRDCFKEIEQGPSIARQFEACGLKFKKYPIKQGVAVQHQVELLSRAMTTLNHGVPMFQIFSNCINTIAELQTWAYKRTASGEIPAGDDAYEDRNNHAIDCLLGFFALKLTFEPQSVMEIGKPAPAPVRVGPNGRRRFYADGDDDE